MKKCLAIGDLFVSPEDMVTGLDRLKEIGYRTESAMFSPGDYDDLQEAARLIEMEGPDAYLLPESLVEKMLDADMIVVHFCPVGRSVIEAHTHLDLIGTCRTGLSNIDTSAAKDMQIRVINCKGRLADAVADFTVGMIICEARNIARGHHGLKTGQWIRRYSNIGNIPDLPGRTVGLVGFGSIGQAVAKRLSGFDMNVLAYDPFVNKDIASHLNTEIVELDVLLKQSDFISIHVDLRPETIDLITSREIGQMKPTAYVINTARPGIINERDLTIALQERRIAGAALDVFDHEPLVQDHPLLSLDNVTLTPHMAGGSDDAFRRSPRLLCEQIIESISGNRPCRL